MACVINCVISIEYFSRELVVMSYLFLKLYAL